MSVQEWLKVYVSDAIARAKDSSGRHVVRRVIENTVRDIADGAIDELAERFPLLTLEIPMLTTAQKAELQAVGIDWQNLDWAKIIAILQAIMALFAANQTAMAAAMPKQSGGQ